MYEHGQDSVIGRQPIAKLTWLREASDGVYFAARLLAGVPRLLISGLQDGLYGSSIRFEPVKTDVRRFPPRSRSDPDGITEKTILQARIREFSVTAFPVYAGTTAQVSATADAPA